MNVVDKIKGQLSSKKLIGIIIGIFLTWFIVAFLVYPNLNLLKLTFFLQMAGCHWSPFKNCSILHVH